MKSMSPRTRSGLSLVELLVVLAIVGVVLGLAVPAVQYTRESARNATCKNHLRQLGIALQNHHSKFGHLPKDGERGWGYGPFLLPELGEQPLYERLKPQSSSLSGGGVPGQDATGVVLKVFLCPSLDGGGQLANGFGRSCYRASSDLFGSKTPLSDVQDGESHTIALGETTTDHGWALPGTGTPVALPNAGGDFGSRHPGGANFLFCDGAVKFLRDRMDAATFAALFTYAGGETLGDF
jgi:prepilin-type processing-associated H-X9-DG protein/prepilin-type N-terminal cleavage/methylation domain-containing protein